MQLQLLSSLERVDKLLLSLWASYSPAELAQRRNMHCIVLST